MDDIDKLINDVPGGNPPSSCRVCSSDILRRAVERWLDRRENGEILPSLTSMHEHLFCRIGGGASMTGLRRHIRSCLRRDHLTGTSIDVTKA